MMPLGVKKHLRVWFKTTLMSLQSHLATKGAITMYILGKFIRFYFVLFLIMRVLRDRGGLGIYTRDEIVFFYLFFTLSDMISQIFFRGVYYFDEEVRSGQLDLRLVKPVNLLFQIMTKITDLLDLPLLVVVIYLIFSLDLQVGPRSILGGMIISLFSFGILTFIHVLIAAVGIISGKAGSLVRIFRDVYLTGRVPVDLYPSAVKSFLFWVIPVGVAATLPAKTFLGLTSTAELTIVGAVFILFGFGCWRLWRFSLTKYSSAGG